MSVKKAQKIAKAINAEIGIDITSYQNSDLEFLKDKLEEFLALEIETDDLQDIEDVEEVMDEVESDLTDNFEYANDEELEDDEH